MPRLVPGKSSQGLKLRSMLAHMLRAPEKLPIGSNALVTYDNSVVIGGSSVTTVGITSAESGYLFNVPGISKFGNPTIFVSMVEWADRIITE